MEVLLEALWRRSGGTYAGTYGGTYRMGGFGGGGSNLHSRPWLYYMESMVLPLSKEGVRGKVVNFFKVVFAHLSQTSCPSAWSLWSIETETMGLTQ